MLTNKERLLPLDAGSVRTVALIGPNVSQPQTQGGGSVRVLPVVRRGISDSVRDAFEGGATVTVHQGCITSSTIAAPETGSLRDPVSGEPGVRVEAYSAEGTLIHDSHFPTSVLTWWDGLPETVHLPAAKLVMRARYRAAVGGPHMLGGAGVGLLRLIVDGSLVAEAANLPPHDVVEALSRPPELRIPLQLEAGAEVDVRFEHLPNARGHQAGFAAMRLGIAPRVDDDRLLDEAVQAASASDVAVLVVGSADGTESEGYDRETMRLPGRQDELVHRVAAANRKTIVVVNSGMPVLMPWAGDVAAILQVWFPGQAFGEALADTLLGFVEPGGRLPVSVPRAEVDSPVLQALPQAGELVYGEGLLVGYRGYDRRGSEPLFAFGHGMGYTDWNYESLALGAEAIGAAQDLPLVLTLRNAGKRSGREVVQVYLEGPDDDASRPHRVLAAFSAVSARPGEEVEARLVVPARSFARYDGRPGKWVWHPGKYKVRAGRSSRDLTLSAQVELR
jgi:beta-glucosidase